MLNPFEFISRMSKAITPAVPKIFPYQLYRISPHGIKYTPTLLPDSVYRWANKKILADGVRNFNLRDIEVIRIDSEFSINRLNILPSPMFPHFGKVLSDEDVIDKVKEEIPVDDEEIVEWMQEATAVNAVLTAREVEFNRHSLIATKSGDVYAPGVYLSDMRFQSISGYTFYNRGYATVIHPHGSTRVNRGSCTDIIAPDFLGWAATAPKNWGVQFTGVLAKIVQLPSSITQSVGFPTTLGRTMPLYTTLDPGGSTKRCEVRMLFASDRDQDMKIAFRDPNDYTRVIDEDTIRIRKGTNEVRFVVASYPAVPPAINHVQPAHGSKTTFERFRVERLS